MNKLEEIIERHPYMDLANETCIKLMWKDIDSLAKHCMELRQSLVKIRVTILSKTNQYDIIQHISKIAETALGKEIE